LSKLPPSSFPITATIFYSSYILPSRPFIPPSQSATTTPIDIKNSSHKSLTTFLKSVEKEGLIKLKDQKGTTKSKSSDLVITGVFSKHVDVLAHRGYTTLKAVEEKKAKKQEKEEGERKKVKEMGVSECWKPWQASVGFFEWAGGRWVCHLWFVILRRHSEFDMAFSSSTLYTLPEIKAKLNDYIVSRNLMNPNDRSYINVDALLSSTLSSKTDTEPLEFLKRDELTQRLVDKMQAWYEISVEGKEPVSKSVSALKSLCALFADGNQ
jgi:translation initiation factor 2D